MNNEELKQRRARQKWTQKEAAKTVGVSERTWQDWERGINEIPPWLEINLPFHEN